jgi:hypothetical protein
MFPNTKKTLILPQLNQDISLFGLACHPPSGGEEFTGSFLV